MSNFDIEPLGINSSLQLCSALQDVLDARVHQRLILGEPVLVKGSLSKALGLPEIQKHLSGKIQKKQDLAKQRLMEIWPTLSETTKEQTLDILGWYEPDALSWDDPRSNRKPLLNPDNE